eukprot:8574046-Alexandrium_andersonii.AAC.1
MPRQQVGHFLEDRPVSGKGVAAEEEAQAVEGALEEVRLPGRPLQAQAIFAERRGSNHALPG